MTPAQQQQLHEIIERLEIIQRDAPQQTVFIMGRTDGSVSSRLLDIIRDLKVFADEPADTTEPETESIAIRDGDGNTRGTINIGKIRK